MQSDTRKLSSPSIVDESEFNDIQRGSDTKKIRFSVERQPKSYTTNGSKILVGICVWNSNTRLNIKKVEFIRETKHYGHLLSVIVETIKAPIYFCIYPILSNNNFLPDNMQCKDSESPFPITKKDTSKLVFDEGKLLLLHFHSFDCYTTQLKSPLKILFYILSTADIMDRSFTTNAISVYQKYQEGADRYLSVLSSTFNGDVMRLQSVIGELNKDINQLDNNSASPLHIAVVYNHKECFDYLIDQKADINIQDKDKRTVLHKAVYFGRDEYVKKLIENNAELNVRDRRGVTPIHLAVLKNHYLCTEILLENNIDITLCDKNGWTALHYACYKNREEHLNLLLKSNIDIEKQDKNKYTALDIAILRGFASCASILLESGGIVTDEFLLQHAAYYGRNDCIKLLLNNQVDPNLVDENISSPLHKAAYNGFNDCIETLIEHGVEISALDESGSTPLHFACLSGNIRALSILLEHSSNVNIKDNNECTPLHNACYSGNSDAVTLLLARGAIVDIPDNMGATPLHYAAEQGHSSCIRILLKYKANIDATDCKQRYPIHYAISDEKSMQILINENVDVNVQDLNGDTPLFLASKLSYENIVRLLLNSGASFSILNYNEKLAINFASNEIKKIFEEEALSVNARNIVREIYDEVALKFNQKPKLGIQHLLESKLNDNFNNNTTANNNNLCKHKELELIVEFLHNHGQHLNRTLVGEYISEPDEKSGDILMAFIQYLNFEDMEFDNALRTFLSKFRLPGEAQKIDRIMEKFAHHYFLQNEKNNIFPTEDQAYLLAFSLIMLNTDLHNPSIKHKMTCEQFVKNNTDTGLEHDLSPEFLGKMYHCIKENEIKMENEDTTFGNSVAVKMGWMTKQGGRIKTWKRRWFILSDHVLYYFKEKQEETSKACGIVPLEDIIVRSAEDKRKYCFELSHSSDTAMKAMKRHQGQIQKGHHDSYFICASNKKEMEGWMEAIAHNNMDNQFKVLMEMKFQKAKLHQISEDLIQFSNLYSSIELCNECDQGKEILKSKYSQVIVEPPYKNIKYCMITHLQHRTHTIVIIGSKWTCITDIKVHLKKKNSIPDYYNIIPIAKTIRRNLQKNFQKDFKIKIVGHCIGGSIGLYVGQLLHEKGIKVTNIICFGAPRVYTLSQLNTIQSSNIPILQVYHIHDTIPRLFPNYISIGSHLVLLKGAHYCYLEKPTKDEIEPSIDVNDLLETSLDQHNIIVYLNSIKEKVDLSVSVQYHLRSHYL